MAFISQKEAAERRGSGVSTLDRLIRDGRLPAYAMGSRCAIRIDEGDLQRYIDSCRVPVQVIPAQRRRKAVAPPPVCRYKPGDKVV